MRRIGLAVAVWLVAGPVLAAPALAETSRPVVLELFTSQGCNSCPPADALLTELETTHREMVLALAFHVTYWDQLGWRDPYASEAFTTRQRDYAAQLASDSIYTPQMVIDGVHDVVGSDRPGVLAAVEEQQGAAASAVSMSLARAAGGVSVTVGAGPAEPARVLVVGFDGQHTTPVKHGENAGKTLTETNVVRGLVQAGAWRGAALALRAALPAGEHLAALLQAKDGRILGAARLD